MSRRPPTGLPDRAEQNRATLKQLVKLEANKTCADCKRNKHPRWASWNLGIFVCIRCSGIHRGMGTHISRVKSVDLDSWTDEQMQSMLRWGNARANRYWESKLAEGHVPNEAKIENFIRTKYDSKRWAMDGPVPDPSTLDDGEADDDVPLNVVQEKAKAEIQRGDSVRNGSAGVSVPQPPRARPQEVDLFGDAPTATAPPPRPSTTEPTATRSAPPKASIAPPKQTRPSESLLGFDFLGGSSSSSGLARSASTGPGTPSTSGRSDLKQSILSLYASKPAAPPAQPASSAFSGMQAPSMTSPSQTQSNALGDLGDAFGSLSFNSASKPAPPQPTSFPAFNPSEGHSRQSSVNKPLLSGGGFFDTKPAPPPKVTATPSQPATTRPASNSFGADWGDFSSAPAAPVVSTKSPPPVSSSMGDLFDMSSPVSSTPQMAASTPALPTATTSTFTAAKPTYTTSAFNLSQPTPVPSKSAAPVQTSSMSNYANMSSADAWGTSDAWSTPDPPSNPAPAAAAAAAAAPVPASTPAPAPAPISAPAPKPVSTYKPAPAPAVMPDFDSGWGDPEPAKSTNTSNAGGFSVQQDEEFGGWSHASPIASAPAPKQGGVSGNSDDLFGNVWE